MSDIVAEAVPRSKQVLLMGRNVFDTLFYVFIITVIVWYIQYHWKRRKLYEKAFKRNGPLSLPFVGNALLFVGSNKDILYNIRDISDKYESPIPVWLGQKLFFYTYEPEQIEVFLNSPKSLGKDDLYQYCEILVGTGLFSAPVDKWKRHRKIIMPTFNQKILDGFVEVFSEKAAILLKQLEKAAGTGNFDIFVYLSRCTLDIICETAMGSKVNAQTTDSDFVKWSNKSMEIMFKRMFVIWYHYDFIFNWTSLAKESVDVADKIHAFTGAVVKQKRIAYKKKMKEKLECPEACFEEETSKSRLTFLDHLIHFSEQEGANFTDEEIREEVDTFMVAGSDTTAATSGFVFMMLGTFPDVQEKVYQEVMDVLGPDRAPEPKDLGKLVYLERVIKETLRIYPAGVLVVRAITEDVKLENDITIPAGCSVIAGIMKTHMHPKIWPNPTKFDPDRFLPEEVAKRHPYSYIPFSAGPRNCVGPKYAMMGLKSLISMVIRKYRFSSDYKTTEDIKCKSDLVLKPEDGFNVSIELRD